MMKNLADDVVLERGDHANAQDGFCLMELVAYVAGEPWSFEPECVSPVLTEFGYKLNDCLPDDLRQQLKPLIPDLIGTRDDGLDDARARIAWDWCVTTYAARFLDLAGLSGHAERLGQSNVRNVSETEDALFAAWDAAWDAARDAATDALAPTVRDLQRSAIDCFERMIAGRWTG